ncbi:hypothetical protein [Rubritalea tangerina]
MLRWLNMYEDLQSDVAMQLFAPVLVRKYLTKITLLKWSPQNLIGIP